MEINKGACIFMLGFFFAFFYKKIKKSFFILYIGLRRIKFRKIENKVVDRELERNVYNPHDYSSEEEMPPSPEARNFKKD